MEEILLETMAEISPSAVLRLLFFSVRSSWSWSEVRNAAPFMATYCQRRLTYPLLANPKRLDITGTCDGLLPDSKPTLALMQCWVFPQQLKSRSEIDRGNVAARRDDRARQEQVNLRRRGLGNVSVL